jgi:tight adherence protein B
LAVLVAVGALPVAAQSSADQPPVVTYVDARERVVEIALVASDYDLRPTDVKLRQMGTDLESQVVTTATEAGWPVEMVFVVDVDRRNAEGGELVTISRAIYDAAQLLPAGSRVGLVTAGRDVDIEIPLTTSIDRLDVALQQLTSSQGAAVIDAVATAGQMFDSDGPGASAKTVRSVVVVSGGPDIGSTGGVAAATSSLVQNAAQLVTVNLGPATPALTDLIASVGGATTVASAKDEIRAAVAEAVGVAADRLLVTFRDLPPDQEDIGQDRVNLTVTIGDQSRVISYVRDMETDNVLQLNPLPELGTSRFSFLGDSWVLYLSVGLAFVGISMGVWALASMFGGGETRLDRVLARYSEGKEVDEEEARELLVQTELLQRAVDLTEKFAQRQGFLTRVERLLERADLPIRPGEGMFLLLGLVILAFGLVWTVTTSLFLGLIVAVAAGFTGYGAVVFRAYRRLRAFEGQLPDTLQLLAGTLRAGYSLPQGIDAVSHEIADPMGEELRRAMAEAQLGRELEDALGAVAERLDSEDFGWAVMAIGIQREVGGNLNELLMTVAETMVQRERLKREVAALTAEGRVSAMILSLMPPGLGVVLYAMNPDYVLTLFSRTLGLILLGLATVSALVGLLWMKKVITIDA